MTVILIVMTEQLSLLCVRGHLQGGSSLSSSVTSSAAARRVRQLPQLPPKSSTVEQGGPTLDWARWWLYREYIEIITTISSDIENTWKIFYRIEIENN